MWGGHFPFAGPTAVARLALSARRHSDSTVVRQTRASENRRPSCEQVFRLFSLAQRNVLRHHGAPVRVFDPELTPLQCQVLSLLRVPEQVYNPGA